MTIGMAGKFSVTSAGKLLLITTVLSGTVAIAQNSNKNPAASKDIKFEVVSLTPIGPGSKAEAAQTFAPTPDGFRSSLTVGQMILLAYGPSNPQEWKTTPLVNWPDWIGNGSDWYLINARVSDADRDAWRNQGSKHELLRTAMRGMLKERCKLLVHENPVQIDVYTLAVEKSGARLKPTTPDSALQKVGMPLASGAVAVPEFRPDYTTSLWHFYRATITDLVEFLSRGSGGHPIHDGTGLTGHYDFALQPVSSPSREPDQEIYNWQFKQLGLEVKLGKGPGFAVAIDHIERPSEN